MSAPEGQNFPTALDTSFLRTTIDIESVVDVLDVVLVAARIKRHTDPVACRLRGFSLRCMLAYIAVTPFAIDRGAAPARERSSVFSSWPLAPHNLFAAQRSRPPWCPIWTGVPAMAGKGHARGCRLWLCVQGPPCNDIVVILDTLISFTRCL